MKFEDKFPGLKGKVMNSLAHITEEKGDTGEIIRKYDVIRSCLDKKKVKEAIKNNIVDCCQCGCSFGREKLLKNLGLEEEDGN